MHQMEAEILVEIKEAEKKAEEMLHSAEQKKHAITSEAVANASKLVAKEEERLGMTHDEKIVAFRDIAKHLKEEKLAEGKTAAKQLKAKSGKNIRNAVDFVMKKVDEMVQND